MEAMASDAVCPKCEGTGFIIIERGGISGAEPCDCRAQGRAARLQDRSQIPVLYQNASFDNFVVPGVENPSARRELTTVLLAVKNFVRDFKDEKRPGLLLIGNTGTGKTHLAVAALRQIIEKGFEGLFYNYQNLLNSIKAGYDPSSNSSNREAYQSALDAEVLLLDDLGAHRTTDWVEDTVNSIITYRCDNRKPLLATTNMPDADAGSVLVQKSGLDKPEYRRTLAEQIGGRARSRLFEMCTVIRMPLVEDYRVRKGKQF
jgi:DNA replication protein DnaC